MCVGMLPDGSVTSDTSTQCVSRELVLKLIHCTNNFSDDAKFMIGTRKEEKVIDCL